MMTSAKFKIQLSYTDNKFQFSPSWSYLDLIKANMA